MIFNLDHVVVDTRGALARAWKALAARKGLPCPENTLNLVLMDTCSERIMMDVSAGPLSCKACASFLGRGWGGGLMEVWQGLACVSPRCRWGLLKSRSLEAWPLHVPRALRWTGIVGP